MVYFGIPYMLTSLLTSLLHKKNNCVCVLAVNNLKHVKILKYYTLTMPLKKTLLEIINQLLIEIACFASAEISPFSSNSSTKDYFPQK